MVTFTQVTEADAGFYMCQASNGVGEGPFSDPVYIEASEFSSSTLRYILFTLSYGINGVDVGNCVWCYFWSCRFTRYWFPYLQENER